MYALLTFEQQAISNIIGFNALKTQMLGNNTTSSATMIGLAMKKSKALNVLGMKFKSVVRKMHSNAS